MAHLNTATRLFVWIVLAGLFGARTAPAQTEQTIAIPIASDELTEPDDAFTIRLEFTEAVPANGYSIVGTNPMTVQIRDNVTAPPTLIAPAAGSSARNPVSVFFTLPEAALPGSVQLVFTGEAVRTLTLAASQETSGAHSFSFDPASPAEAGEVANIDGGVEIPDGLYTVSLNYRDADGHPVATASADNVRLDTVAPVLERVPADGYLLEAGATGRGIMPDVFFPVPVSGGGGVLGTQGRPGPVALSTGGAGYHRVGDRGGNVAGR